MRGYTDENGEPNVRKILTSAIIGVGLVITLIFSGKLIESADANEIMVIQSPLSGSLSFYTTPGPQWQGGGRVTHYVKRAQYSFSARKKDDDVNEAFGVQFVDGGTATISGVISWEMPTDTKGLRSLHTLYGSQHAVEQQLVRPAIERSLYLTSTLMSSQEAVASRKAEFLRFFEDQVKNGIYQTSTVSQKQPDPVTGVEKTVQIVQIARSANGQEVRASESPLKQFGITILPPAIDKIDFDKTVTQQIAQQQQAIMQVQTAQARAREAEQEAITTAKKGEAEAAKAKWAQEAIKAKLVTEAEQDFAVAKLKTQTAEQYKLAQVLRGEGDAAYRQKVMQADGALSQKLDAWVKVNNSYADAIKNYAGAWVPSVMMGSSSGQSTGGAFDMMSLLAVNSARQLSLDLGKLGTNPKTPQAGAGVASR